MNKIHVKKWLESGVIRLTFAAVAVMIISVFALVNKSQAETQQITKEESQFTWSNTTNTTFTDTAASGGTAIKLVKNSIGNVTVVTDKITGIKVTAKADECEGNPNMQVKLDGAVIANQSVGATTWTDYSFPITKTSGSHQLEVSFTNQYSAVWFGAWVRCVRALNIDKAVIATETVSSPTPTPTPSPSPSTSPSPTPAPGTIPEGSEYVALGDSYSSGMGADRTPSNLTINQSVYDPATTSPTNGCRRTTTAGQVLLAADLKLVLTNAACAGATTANMLTTGQYGEPAQLNRLSLNTKLATMTIGGNDTDIMWVVGCIQQGDCTRNGWWINNYNLDRIEANIAALPEKIKTVLRTATQKAPNAKIRIAGYPYILAAAGESKGTCAAWMVDQEQIIFDDYLTKTNNHIKAAAESIAIETGKNVKYVDPRSATSPFMQRDNGQMLDGCSTSMQRYMNGPNDGTESGWHPNIYGQRMYSELYKSSL
jgi:hypothetical protein